MGYDPPRVVNGGTHTTPSQQLVGAFIFKRVDTTGKSQNFAVFQVESGFGYNKPAAWLQAVEEANRMGVYQTASLELIAEPKVG